MLFGIRFGGNSGFLGGCGLAGFLGFGVFGVEVFFECWRICFGWCGWLVSLFGFGGLGWCLTNNESSCT